MESGTAVDSHLVRQYTSLAFVLTKAHDAFIEELDAWRMARMVSEEVKNRADSMLQAFFLMWPEFSCQYWI
jgi:hypothetical protein